MSELRAGTRMAVRLMGTAGLFLISCATENVGEALRPGIPIDVGVSVPDSMRGGEQATWQVLWVHGTPPYTVTLELGGGGWEDFEQAAADSGPVNHETWMVNDSITAEAQYKYTATVTDAAGASGTASGSYSVAPLIPVLEITGMSHDGQGLVFFSVASNHPDGPDATVSATGGIAVPQPPVEAHDSPDTPTVEQHDPPGVRQWDFVVPCRPLDIIDGNSGTVTVSAADSWGNAASESIDVALAGLYEIPFHSLAAIPLKTRARVGEEVTVVVACGDFPADRPLRLLVGVRLTADSGVEYVPNSLNFGAPGGPWHDFDGLWDTMDPPPEWFILPDIFGPDGIDGIAFFDLSDRPGRVGLDFVLIPAEGGDTTRSGALYSLRLRCEKPGLYRLGFQQLDPEPLGLGDASRTYYQGDGLSHYFWADISNNYPDVPNTITVTE